MTENFINLSGESTESSVFLNVFDKNITCAVTGHRRLENKFDKYKLLSTLNQLIESGYSVFLTGMALGFDSECFKALYYLKTKENKDVKIIACVPCRNQDKNFSPEKKTEYNEMLNRADKIVLLSENYTAYCMQKRNMFMVDNCSLLLAHLLKEKGGTANTVNYAINKGKKILYI